VPLWKGGHCSPVGNTGTVSQDGSQLHHSQSHLPQLSTPFFNQGHKNSTLPLFRPAFHVLHSSNNFQNRPLPAHLTTSHFQPSQDSHLPPIQNWIVTLRPSVASIPHPTPFIPPLATTATLSESQEDVLSEGSAPKQAALKKKAVAKKQLIHGDTNDFKGSQSVRRRCGKAVKVGPSAGKRGRVSKSRLKNASVQHAHTPSTVPVNPEGITRQPFEDGRDPALRPLEGDDSSHWAQPGLASDSGTEPPRLLPVSQAGESESARPLGSELLQRLLLPQIGLPKCAQQRAPPTFLDWESYDRPIASEYENYKCSMELYQIDQPRPGSIPRRPGSKTPFSISSPSPQTSALRILQKASSVVATC
jgi:hypothetical protein